MEMSAITTIRLLEGILKGGLKWLYFVMGPYLNDGQRQVLLTLSKINTLLHVMII